MLLPSDPAPSAHLHAPLVVPPASGDQAPSPALLDAASCLTQCLAEGRALGPELVRLAMIDAYGGSDADGRWTWREAYDACEAAQVLFLRRHGPAMLAQAAGKPGAVVTMLERLASLAPSQTKRSEGSVALQQFSTPLPLGYVASLAAGTRPGDVVLEPSAGLGMLAVFAEIAGAALALNEIAPARAALLASLFPAATVTRYGSEAIDDRLDADVRPSVILMNPPFSASPHVDDRRAEATWKHVSSALRRLRPGGRLVAITATWFTPEDPAWSSAFDRFAERGGRLVMTVPIAGRVFARHGTTVATRLTIIDKVAGASSNACVGSLPEVADVAAHAKTGAETRLLRVVQRERRRPLSLFEAFQLARAEPGSRLLVNTRSGRAAVQVPAWSLTREDGSVETRVRLVKPIGRGLLAIEELAASQWREANRALFASTWEADVARLPEFHESTFHVLSGLLLPIWTRLPSSTARVYRLRTDDGERVIGRVVEADALDGVLQRLGVEGERPSLSPLEAFQAVLDRGATLHLADGLQVRRSLVMGAQRIEVSGFGDRALASLKALGLWTEIIAWKLRLFIPADPELGPVILGSLFERHALMGVGTRSADRSSAAA